MLDKPCTTCDKPDKKKCMCGLWSKWYAEQLELGFPDKPILNLKKKKLVFNPKFAEPKQYDTLGDGLLIKGGKRYQRKEL